MNYITTIDAMEKYGCSFVKSLAGCLRSADVDSMKKLHDAFPDYISHYKNMARIHNINERTPTK